MGMFGIINPQVTTSVQKSFGNWMENHARNDADFNTMMEQTKSDCEGYSEAWTYGQSKSSSFSFVIITSYQ
jgi:hypothetical protein